MIGWLLSTGQSEKASEEATCKLRSECLDAKIVVEAVVGAGLVFQEEEISGSSSLTQKQIWPAV